MAPESDVLVALTPVIEALEHLGIAYHLGGSIASSVWGVARATNDVAVVAAIQTRHVTAICQQLTGDYYASEELLHFAIQHHTCCNFIHLGTTYKVDVFVRPQSTFDDLVMARAIQKPLAAVPGARTFAVATPEDIVLRKLVWYRAGDEVAQQQWRDVLGVLRVQGNRLDLGHLRHWATPLGVNDLLERALAEASVR